MKEWTFNNIRQKRWHDKPIILVVLKDGTIQRWKGENIPGNAIIIHERYEKNGKWSNTEWQIQAHDKVVFIRLSRDWETGFWFPGLTLQEVKHFIKSQAPHANWESFLAIVDELCREDDLVQRHWNRVVETTKQLQQLEEE
jgi:hypothetical protein